MILYKPLEDVLADLEKQAKAGDRKGFVQTSVKFYAQMGDMQKRMRLIQTQPHETEDSSRHYQTRYDQLKLLLGREQ